MNIGLNPDETVFEMLAAGDELTFDSDGWLNPMTYVWIATNGYESGKAVQVTLTEATATLKSALGFPAPAPQGPFLTLSP
jgi:hypothetical protein